MQTSRSLARQHRLLIRLLMFALSSLATSAAMSQTLFEPLVQWSLSGRWNNHSGSDYRGSFTYDPRTGSIGAIDFHTPDVWWVSSDVAFPWHYGETAVGQLLPGEILITDRGDSGFDAPDGSPLFNDYELHISRSIHPEVGTRFDPADPASATSIPIRESVSYWAMQETGPTRFTLDQGAYASAWSQLVAPPVPEPASSALMGIGLGAIAGMTSRKKFAMLRPGVGSSRAR